MDAKISESIQSIVRKNDNGDQDDLYDEEGNNKGRSASILLRNFVRKKDKNDFYDEI